MWFSNYSRSKGDESFLFWIIYGYSVRKTSSHVWVGCCRIVLFFCLSGYWLSSAESCILFVPMLSFVPATWNLDLRLKLVKDIKGRERGLTFSLRDSGIDKRKGGDFERETDITLGEELTHDLLIIIPSYCLFHIVIYFISLSNYSETDSLILPLSLFYLVLFFLLLTICNNEVYQCIRWWCHRCYHSVCPSLSFSLQLLIQFPGLPGCCRYQLDHARVKE